MSFAYKCARVKYSGGSVIDLIKKCNGGKLPEAFTSKLEPHFQEHNPGTLTSGQTVWVPILPPFFKEYEAVFDKDDLEPITVDAEQEPEKPMEVAKPKELTVEERLAKRPVRKAGVLQYRLYPYTFARPNETIEAVIRLYNDMKVDKAMLSKLSYEFSEANKDALPPKLGQTVKIPVLLPFCYRHENENKIFTDE